MSAPKWTPGPWRVGQIDGDTLDASVRLCVFDVWDDMAEQDANARLISLAPEMFVALRALVEDADSDDTDENRVNLSSVARARLALTRARGEGVS